MRITVKLIVLSHLLAAQVVAGFNERLLQFDRYPILNLLTEPSEDPSDGLVIQDSRNRLPGFMSIFRFYNVRGMWALYTEKDFQGKCFTIAGNGGSVLYSPTDFDFMDIKSIRQLSDPFSTTKNRFEAFVERNFVGKSVGVLENNRISDVQPLSVKSIAVYVPTRHVIMCAEISPTPEDSRNCICLNGLKLNSYIISDLTAVEINGTRQTVRKMRQLGEYEEKLCDQLPSVAQRDGKIYGSLSVHS